METRALRLTPTLLSRPFTAFGLLGLLLGVGCVAPKRVAALEAHAAALQADLEAHEAEIADLRARLDGAADNQAQHADRIEQLEGEMAEQEATTATLRDDLDDTVANVYRELRMHQSLWRYADTRVRNVETRLGITAPEPPDDASAHRIAGGEPEGLVRIVRRHIEQGEHRTARELLLTGMEHEERDEVLAELRWLEGETWYGQGSWGQAASVYQLVTEAHAESPWAAWSLLRLGQCFEEMGEIETARIFFEDVLARHPDSPAAEEARRHVEPKPAIQ